MAKIWKYVLILALVLLAFGVLLAGTGLLTGASFSRVWSALALNQRLNIILENFRSLPLPFPLP